MTREETNWLLLAFLKWELTRNEDGWEYVYRRGDATVSTTEPIDLFNPGSAANYREEVRIALLDANCFFDEVKTKDAFYVKITIRFTWASVEFEGKAYAEAFCEAACAAILALKESETK